MNGQQERNGAAALKRAGRDQAMGGRNGGAAGNKAGSTGAETDRGTYPAGTVVVNRGTMRTALHTDEQWQPP